MKNHLHIVRKSYLGVCRTNDCLPTTYNDAKSMIFENIAIVSACFIWGYILWLCKPEMFRILYIEIRGASGP